MRKLKNKKGFTLAELLIVIAIIAVLVGISIPVFGAQLKKAHFAVDLANVRAEYAEQVTKAMLEQDVSNTDDDFKITITFTDFANDETSKYSKVTYDATSHKVLVELAPYEGEFPVDEDITVNGDTTEFNPSSD